MEDFNFNLSKTDLSQIVRSSIQSTIEKSLSTNKESIQTAIGSYFTKNIFSDKESQFNQAIDWAVEDCFRLGIHKALEELNFKELVAIKAKELLSDETFLRDVAEKKVRQSLGLATE